MSLAETAASSVSSKSRAAFGIGRVLQRLFALALNLPGTLFDDKVWDVLTCTFVVFARDPQLKRYLMMRGLHHSPQTGPEDNDIIGIGAHSEFVYTFEYALTNFPCSFEHFTTLWKEPGIQAPQIQNSGKKWINATHIPGTLVINIGDLLSRWTINRAQGDQQEWCLPLLDSDVYRYKSSRRG
ncbi:hypothetical protein BKA83DRAFT_4490373 [Pisolithus microcarpus]|nr:hypothetical protein BKA83DRAFT_4490373 [Pisolithus microcarpus]